ncbi:MAG: radical SAM protein [Thermodesulfobacteriota bacterium]|nr:radical SAM protein [Thermodesulfobacteriota bacterium]
MPNIVLFNPAVWKSVGDVVLPLSLLAISSFLKSEYEVEIIDQQVDPKWKNNLRNALKREPLCVGITCITGRQVQFALSASCIVKDESDIKVVWGGIQASQAPEVTLSHPLIDIIVTGEGYLTFPELVEALNYGEHLAGVRGIWFKEGKKLIKNQERPFVEMDQLPNIPYHLVDVEKYIRKEGKSRSLDIITSSGCPYSCNFCYNNAFHKSCWRGMKAEKVIENIKTLINRYDINHIRVLDDQFFVNKKRDLQVVNGIREIVQNGRSDFHWEVMGAHVNSVVKWDDAFLKALDESNCEVITVGIEAASHRIQKMIKKGLTMEKVLQVNQLLKKTGIRPLYSFMSGFPTETDDDIKEMINLMDLLKNENPNIDCGLIHPYVPYPGTELYKMAVQKGYKAPETLEDWAEYSWDKYTQLSIPWLSKRRQRMLLDLYYCSALMNPDYTYVTSKIYPYVARLFSRLARYRMKELDFRFPVEIRLMEFAKKVFVESN